MHRTEQINGLSFHSPFSVLCKEIARNSSKIVITTFNFDKEIFLKILPIIKIYLSSPNKIMKVNYQTKIKHTRPLHDLYSFTRELKNCKDVEVLQSERSNVARGKLGVET